MIVETFDTRRMCRTPFPRVRSGVRAKVRRAGSVIIFGWGGGRPKDQGAVVPMSCPNCNNDTVFRYVIARKWFTLFFIPVIPYETKHFLICPVCTGGKQLGADDARRAKQMIRLTYLWTSDLMSDEPYLEAVAAFRSGEEPPAASLALAPGSSSIQAASTPHPLSIRANPAPSSGFTVSQECPGWALGSLADGGYGILNTRTGVLEKWPSEQDATRAFAARCDKPVEPLVSAPPGLVWTHTGVHYILGYSTSPAAYCIWNRDRPGRPSFSFPYTERGKKQAATKFRKLEPAGKAIADSPASLPPRADVATRDSSQGHENPQGPTPR